MQRPPKEIGRKMIPRWRPLRLTPSQELVSAKSKVVRRLAGPSVDQITTEWSQSPSLWAAADMVSMGLVDGRSVATDAAAALLRAHMDELAEGARQIVLAYFDDPDAQPQPGMVTISREIRYRQIKEIKDEISLYPRNAILYVDLARAYVSLGQNKKATKAFEIALSLTPHNRFVLRSAIRFFVFEGKAERAWHALREAPKDDVWLLASRVAVADLLDKPQESGRRLRQIIEGGRPAQTTELAAALATLELDSGGNKLAKRLFRLGCQVPTDNTIAQTRWAHEVAGIPFNKALLKNALTFEARTGNALEESDWAGAVHNASVWLGDEPFSGRAAGTGAFVAAEMLRDFGLSETIATSGLMVNPHDPVLLNNRAYSRACQGNLLGAISDINIALSKNLEETDRICLEATQGCIAYRSGDRTGGSIRYRNAIVSALSTSNKAFAQRAFIHWLFEDGTSGGRLGKVEAEKVRRYFADTKIVDRETREIFRVNAEQFLVGAETNIEPSDLEGVLELLTA